MIVDDDETISYSVAIMALLKTVCGMISLLRSKGLITKAEALKLLDKLEVNLNDPH